MNGNEIVAEFIHGITWEQLPSEVQHKARQALLDTLGATLVGTLTPVSRITAEYATTAFCGEEATILVHGLRATAAGAALANGCAANGIDIDDCAKYTRGHPGAQILPTALAVGEKLTRTGVRAVTGAEILAAMVAGYEVAHRTARCWHDHHEVYQACGSWGSVSMWLMGLGRLRCRRQQTDGAGSRDNRAGDGDR
jgi:2-methylcitrate dehydratase PrpD